MIDIDGSLRCDKCGKKLAAELKGEIRIVCPRCKHYNTFETAHTAAFERINLTSIKEYDSMTISN